MNKSAWVLLSTTILLTLCLAGVFLFPGYIFKKDKTCAGEIKEIAELKQKNELLAQEGDKLKNDYEFCRVSLNDVEKYSESELVAMKTRFEELEKNFDELKTILKEEIEKGDVTLTKLNKVVKIEFKDKVFFNSGYAHINLEGKAILQKIAGIVSKIHKNYFIYVIGHTDNVPIGGRIKHLYKTNFDLGQARARNVLYYIFDEDKNIDQSRFAVLSFGENQPATENTDKGNRSQNRRIEIQILDNRIFE